MATDWGGTEVTPVKRKQRPVFRAQDWLAAGVLLVLSPVVGLVVACLALEVLL